MLQDPTNGKYYQINNGNKKKPVKALMVYPQSSPNQYIAQPQPMYQMATQPYGMMQPVPQVNPQMVVPVGPPQYVPIGQPVMMAQPIVTPKPVAKQVKPVKKQPRKPDKIIIIQKQPRPEEDDCCNIF